ncbi:hypothetical protein B0H17DRAFT_1038052 [Mycena rosella]|uniref:Uncharacterized protein n=1 Tax=Mycena rosella TaxID=1033263 RepID=A0AAD7GU98_MYCRO|nr:hypothetical protein B0H17DRAFT_1038052 [Mycena rosella]
MDGSTLPTDLERKIFETAALMHPNTIPVLLRVARRVLVWIEPLLYRVLRISSSDPLTVLDAVRRAMKAKPANFFRDNVRHICLSSLSWSVKDTYALLRLCPRVVTLSTMSRFLPPLHQIEQGPFALLQILLEMPQLRKWGGSLTNLFGSRAAIDPTHPVFRNITHLDLFDDLLDAQDARICTSLATMPALTHLSLFNEVRPGIFQRVLDECASLRALVHMWHDLHTWEAHKIAAEPPVTDVRFVVRVFHDYWADWEAGARGDTDRWAAADAFIERKRRGEIDPSYYWLDY